MCVVCLWYVERKASQNVVSWWLFYVLFLFPLLSTQPVMKRIFWIYTVHVNVKLELNNNSFFMHFALKSLPREYENGWMFSGSDKACEGDTWCGKAVVLAIYTIYVREKLFPFYINFPLTETQHTTPSLRCYFRRWCGCEIICGSGVESQLNLKHQPGTTTCAFLVHWINSLRYHK